MKYSLLFFSFLGLLNNSFAETAPPDSVGMSSERLDRIAPMIEEYIESKSIGGAVTLVARRGTIVHLEARGKFGDGSGRDMTDDAIFGLASMTKPIAHVAAMMLA